MNRAFKIEFHNGEPDGKPIVTVGLAVRNGKRFHALNEDGRQRLVSHLKRFRDGLDGFINEVSDGFYHTKTDKIVVNPKLKSKK